jgi:hypothetical protein
VVAGRLGVVGGVRLSFDDLFAVLVVRAGWAVPVGIPAVRLIDALWQRDFDDVRVQALRLRRQLEADGVVGQDATRVAAGLALHRAQAIIAAVHGVGVRDFRRGLHLRADEAKRLGLFPWHLLDG